MLVSPVGPPGPCILVFLTPGLTFLKEEEGEQESPHKGNFTQEKTSRHSPAPDWDWQSSSSRHRIGGSSTSAQFYYKLSQERNEDMEQGLESFLSIQRPINSLASVALQNRRALDLLTAAKGGTCLFLGDVCCYFVNETGVVQGRVKELRQN